MNGELKTHSKISNKTTFIIGKKIVISKKMGALLENNEKGSYILTFPILLT